MLDLPSYSRRPGQQRRAQDDLSALQRRAGHSRRRSAQFVQHPIGKEAHIFSQMGQGLQVYQRPDPVRITAQRSCLRANQIRVIGYRFPVAAFEPYIRAYPCNPWSIADFLRLHRQASPGLVENTSATFRSPRVRQRRCKMTSAKNSAASSRVLPSSCPVSGSTMSFHAAPA